MEWGILGPLVVHRDGQALALGGAKQRAVLAVLLIHANRVVSVDRLAELLWTDETPADAGHVIEVYVSQLRRVLEPDGAPYRVLVRTAPGYVLHVAHDDLDATRFQSLIEDARGRPPEEAATRLRQALELWRGPALANFATEPFALGEAKRLNELRLHALEQRIDADLAMGRHGQLIAELEALVRENPLRERFGGQLMLALYRSGRQAEASDVYQRTRERLVDELGMEPGPELQALLKRILQQDPDLASPSRAAASDPGLPSGTLTFLLTDVQDSTDKWERHHAAMGQAMALHDEILERRVIFHGGSQVESGREGDSVLAAFTRASDAISCAVEIQREFQGQEWPTEAELHIRVAIHSGEAELRAGHYYGRSVYRCARLMAIGHGQQVLLSQAAHDLVVDALPEGVSLRDMGLHRLRDLQRAERVYQVVADGLRANFPPLKSLDPRRHNLPISPTTFIGRSAELSELKGRLETDRMLTLLGAAGTGKTRLALQAAVDLSDVFPDGVWLVELASINDPDLVPQTVAEALGLQEEVDEQILSTLGRWLRDKRLLLLVDNCEHLVTAVASLAARLLRESPGVQLLATSREALRVAGEKIMRVDPLPEADAVLLFAERSLAVQPSFRLTADNVEAVTQICRRVEGIPLAIELAAGRARMMSPAEILARLQDSFRVLAGGSRTADPRHQTILAAVDWSYRLLNDGEKQLFRQLSVFSNGFTLEAAEAVGNVEGTESVLDLLGQLLDKSLVTSHETEGGGTRYSLLEAVREYGQARLVEEGELESIQQRHTAFYVEFAETAHQNLNSADRVRALRRIGDDIDNLRSVFDTPGVAPDNALRLAAAMRDLWDLRGDFTEGRARLQAALRGTSTRSLIRARALLGLAPMAGAQGDEEAAAQYCREALELFRELGDVEGEASSLQRLGQSLVQLEKFDEARSCLNEALQIATSHGFDEVRAVCFWRLGMVDLFAGDMPAAREQIVASLALSRELYDSEMVALSLLMLGNIALWQGRLAEARANLSEGLETWRRDGNARAIANFIESLAAEAAAEGQKERALRLGGAAEALRMRGSVVPSSPFHREIRSRLETLRQDPHGRESWGLGAQMSRDEAIDYALSVSSTDR